MLFAIIPFLWIIVASLLVYAVVSEKSGSGSIIPIDPNALPPIPQEAEVRIVLVGNEFTICTPDGPDSANTGLIGNNNFAVGNKNGQFFKLENINTLGVCMSVKESAIESNVWYGDFLNYHIVSTNHTLEQMIAFYFSNYTNNNLGRPSAFDITNTTLTIASSLNVAEGNWGYEFIYGTDPNLNEYEIVSGSRNGNFIEAEISQLTSGETYYFRCDAYNNDFSEFFESVISLGIETL